MANTCGGVDGYKEGVWMKVGLWFIGAVVLCLGSGWTALRLTPGPLPGVTLGGRVLDGRPLHVQIPARARAWEAGTVMVTAGEGKARVPRRELGVRVDRRESVRRVLRAGRQRPAWVALGYFLFRDARHAPWAVTVDRGVMDAWLRRFAERTRRPPEEGMIDFGAEVVTPTRVGEELDVPRARAVLSEHLLQGAARVTLPVTTRGPYTRYVPPGLSLRTRLAESTTAYRRHGEHHNRAHNIRLAAKRLDRWILASGQVMSFNIAVGERRARAGFLPARGIVRGEFQENYGGGVCQVASTLHAAALWAGLEILEHSPHSRPVPYLPLGFDAAVVYPEIDLKVRNRYPFSVVLQSRAREGQLTVAIWGDEGPRNVEVERTFGPSRAFAVITKRGAGLAPGARRVVQMGSRGHTLERTRRVWFRDHIWEDVVPLVYKPVDRWVHVGP